jgi:hypothetical protein
VKRTFKTSCKHHPFETNLNSEVLEEHRQTCEKEGKYVGKYKLFKISNDKISSFEISILTFTMENPDINLRG